MVDFKDMTEEELRILEDASIASAQNMGAPKDLWVDDYGWILWDGKPTDAGIQWYKDNKDKLEKK